MKNSFFLIIVILFLLGACNNTTVEDSGTVETAEPDPVSQETNMIEGDSIILFFGNSLTAGYGLDMSEAFPAIIQKKLDSVGLGYEVRNSGLSGETTTGGNSRVEFVLGTLRKPLAVFVLELGGNDGLRAIQPSESKKNLESIILKVKAAHPEARILLCGMEAPPNLGDEFTSEFRNMYPTLAEKHSIALLPFLLEGVGGEPELNLPDGIHPTVEGHKIVAKNVWKALRPLLNTENI